MEGHFGVYKQYAMEIKSENRCLGQLQIHHASMDRLSRHDESFISAEEARSRRNDTSRKVDPILAIRSIFAPRRANSNDDLSKMVLPGRRSSSFIPEHKSNADGCSDSDSIIGITKSNKISSTTVVHDEESDMEKPQVQQDDTPVRRPRESKGKRRLSLVSVDHDCDIPRRSSKDCGSSLICEFPATYDTLICDWGPRQLDADDSSVGSLSSEEWFFGQDE